MVNNIPVNGWPQLKDLEAVQPTLDRLDKIEAWKRTVKVSSFTGEEITIPNALALPARSLITEINAIQDLHGLLFPYVGGAYKNKLPMTVSGIKALNTAGTWSGNVYTWNGNTFEILTDSANNVLGIKVGGTNNGTACRFQVCDEGFIGDGSYYLNGSSTDFSGGQTQLYTKYSASNYAVSYNGADTPFTVSGGYTIGGVYILVDANISFSSPIIYRPMIRLSTESDASFAPYSNICPISGRTAAVITRSDGDEISEDFTIQLGTTVYGADINWDTGVMTVEWVEIAPTNIVSVQYNSGLNLYYWYVVDNITGINGANVISSHFEQRYEAKKGCCYLSNDGKIINAIPSDQTLNTKTLADAWMAANAPQFVYKLATPLTFTLTPTEVQMLKGYNRVTLSDGYGTIELKALTGANWS